MKTFLKHIFNDNPLITDTNNYFGKMAAAVQVGLIGAISCSVLGALGLVVFVIGALKQWW